ncbi:MAG: chorismate synthase [Culturomica sp.]|jgi:chorismate synthase|nr:chorismate synthase [Culturomica sp.]
MAGNSFGKIYTLSSFGESHGEAVGGVIDGCPAGLALSVEQVQAELDRRRPGYSDLSTPRREADRVEFLSGLSEGVTTGMPIGFLVRNTDRNSRDYDELKEVYRPSHADYSWQQKYGIRDCRGGGRSSAREQIARVVGGAVARQVLSIYGIQIESFISRIGTVGGTTSPGFICRPDPETVERMNALVRQVKEEGDSIGGTVDCVISGVKPGVGEPVFRRLQAQLAHAMLTINAARGFEYGSGFAAASMRGSEHNDAFVPADGGIRTATNRSGGIQGGVSNGEEIYFRVAFKPVATIACPQETVDREGRPVTLRAKGRHDPCVVPRAVPVVEAMAAMVLLDLLLEQRTTRL